MLRRVAIGARICLVARGLRTHVHLYILVFPVAACRYVFAISALLQLRIYKPLPRHNLTNARDQ